MKKYNSIYNSFFKETYFSCKLSKEMCFIQIASPINKNARWIYCSTPPSI